MSHIETRSKVILNLKIVFLSLFSEGSPNFFLMISRLILNLFNGSNINKLLEVLSALGNMVPSIEASVLASWGVGEVIIEIGTERLLPGDSAKILIAHFYFFN